MLMPRYRIVERHEFIVESAKDAEHAFDQYLHWSDDEKMHPDAITSRSVEEFVWHPVSKIKDFTPVDNVPRLLHLEMDEPAVITTRKRAVDRHGDLISGPDHQTGEHLSGHVYQSYFSDIEGETLHVFSSLAAIKESEVER